MADLGGIVGYNFEPEWPADQRGYSSDSEDSSSSDNLDDDHVQPCQCGLCVDMATPAENLCCKHHVRLQDDIFHELSCITAHHEFNPIVLQRPVLEMAYLQFLQYKGRLHEAPPRGEGLTNRWV